MKPFSEACEQNKWPILEVLRIEFKDATCVLEIGSGTGQHAVFFGTQLPHLHWHTSDVDAHHAGIQMWLDEAGLANVFSPINLDVAHPQWPTQLFDGVFSANTTHIMSWPEVEQMMAGIGRVLQNQGRFCLYGPFNQNGDYTSASNASFDAWLKQRDPQSGIRDMEALIELAAGQQLEFARVVEMPANNKILVWHKR